MEAVDLEISVTNKICLAIEPFLVRMAPAQIEDFMIDFQSLWNFKRNPHYEIQDVSIQQPYCYVLPSLKKGRLHSITHTIPKHAPFKNYEDLRQHWKLTYGYRLPADECHLYYNVSFMGSTAFSYPEYCIRSHDIIRYYRCDQESTCESFLQDIISRMSNLFTSQLCFTRQSLYWQKSFPTADQGNRSCLSKDDQERRVPNFKPNPQPLKERFREPFQYVKDANYHQNVVRFCNQISRSNSANMVMKPVRSIQGSGFNRYERSPTQVLKEDTVEVKEFSKQNVKTSDHVTYGTSNGLIRKPNELSLSGETNLKLQFSNKNLYKFKQVGDEAKQNSIFIPDSPFFEQIVPDEILDAEQQLNISRGTTKEVDKDIPSQRVPTQRESLRSNENEYKVIEQKKESSDNLSTNFITENSSINDLIKPNENVVQVNTEISKKIDKGAERQQASECPEEQVIDEAVVPESHNAVKDAASTVPQKKFVPIFKSKVKGKLQSTNTKKTTHQSNKPFPKLSSTNNLVPSQPNSKYINNNCIKPTFMIRKNLKQTGSNVTVNPLKRKPTLKKGGPENNCNINQHSAAKKVKTVNTLPSDAFARKSSELTSILHSSNKLVSEKGLTKNDKMTRVAKVKTLKVQSPQIQNNKPAICMDRTLVPLVMSSTKDKVGIPKSPQKYSKGVSLAMEILSQASKSSQHAEILSPKTDMVATQYQIPDSTVSNTKKSRTKPKIQDNIDVEVMAHNKLLNKVNTVTLKDWLKGKGVRCKASDKKEELVKKVEVFLGIYQEELKQQIMDFVSTPATAT